MDRVNLNDQSTTPNIDGRWPDAIRFGLIGALTRRQVLTLDTRAYLNLEVWISANESSARLDSNPALARGPVRSIVCKSAEEQTKFDVVFDEWLQQFQRSENQRKSATIHQPQHEKAWTQLTLLRHRRWIGLLVICAVLASVGVVVLVSGESDDIPVVATPPTSEVSSVTQPAPTENPASSIETPTAVEVQTQAAAPATSPRVRLFGIEPMVYLAIALGLIALSAAIAGRARVTRAQTGRNLSHQEVFARQLIPVAGNRRRLIRDAVRVLRLPVENASKKALNLSATINATAARAGFLSVQYRSSFTAFGLVVLVDRLRPNDQQAYWAIESFRDIAAEGISVSIWEYDRDPRWISPVSIKRQRKADPPPRYVPLNSIIASHSNKGLIIASDGQGLVDPMLGSLHSWLADAFSAWPRRVIVTPRPMASWGAIEELLAGNSMVPGMPEFLLLPHQSNSWLAAAIWLRHGALATITEVPASPASYPTELVLDPDRWITSSTPSKEERAVLLTELLHFLGPDAYTWLAASAAHPVTSAELTAYFARGLSFVDSDSEGKKVSMDARLLESRLIAIAQLPWCRHAHMPDWLRLELLASIPLDVRHRIRQLLEALFDQACTGEADSSSWSLGRLVGEDPTRLRWRSRTVFRSLVADARKKPTSSPLHDSIYVGVLQGSYDRELDPAATDALLRAVRSTTFERMSIDPLRWLGAILLTIWFIVRWTHWQAMSHLKKTGRPSSDP